MINPTNRLPEAGLSQDLGLPGSKMMGRGFAARELTRQIKAWLKENE